MKLGTTSLACLIAALLAGPAVGQYGTGYEDYDASADGVALTDQGGYYMPTPETSVDCLVYTYTDNPLLIQANPNGGEKFVAGTGPADSVFARAQITPDPGMFGDGTGMWTVSYDVAVSFTGERPSAQNVGSFSLQPEADPLNPSSSVFIGLAQWSDPALADGWDANYIAYDADGNYVYPSVVPDEAFQNLQNGHWYRWSTTFDFDTNMIVQASITDLTTGETTTAELDGWYLGGGAVGGLDTPTGFRYFAGSSTVAGNTMAFDNMEIVPEPGCFTALSLLGLLLLRRR